MFGSTSKPAAPATPASNGTHHQPTYSPAPTRSGAVLSSGVSITGDVKFGSELVIDGEVEGNITSNGRLIIGTHGTVVGDIQVGHVTIQGTVAGNVLATERCSLEAGSNLQGDVEAPRLAVDENASFTGRATITTKSS